MVVSAAHFNEVTNGYEKRSDGLWVHKGKLDAGYVRATNNLPPLNGAGTEVGFNPASGFVQAYDRTLNVYRDLFLTGRNVTLDVHGGAVGLPAGSITTGMLAESAAQQFMGSYFGIPAWSISTSAWTESPIQVSASIPAGATGFLRIEATFCVYNATLPSYTQAGIGWNGGLQYPLCAISHVGTGNYPMPGAFVFYIAASAFAATTVRFAVFFAATGGGTMTLHPAPYHTLYVNWQKR